MVYENSHNKALGIWLDLVLKVKYGEILIFKALFLFQKSTDLFKKKEYKNGGQTFTSTIHTGQRSLHNLTQFCGMFDTNVVPGSMLQKDLEYSFIRCQNLIVYVFVNLKPISYVLYGLFFQFEKKSFQFWRAIWNQVMVISLQLWYRSSNLAFENVGKIESNLPACKRNSL